MSPTLGNIKRKNGVAGQVSWSTTVSYPGEDPATITFVGSTYGGPVVMVVGDRQTFVTDPSRFGPFGAQWVRNFFAD